MGLEKLKAMKAHLETASKETEAAINTKLSDTKAVLEEKKQTCADAKKRLQELVEDKKTETKEAIADWKATLNSKKLQMRAERTKKYAESCVEIALYAALEAEKAILEAVAARKDADRAI